MGRLSTVLCGALLLAIARAQDAEYGVDVSFPMHHRKISDNFAWLPHNTDPDHHSTPSKYKDMVVSPLPGREEMYQDFIKTCEDAFGTKGARCRMTEQDRIDMSLRQPQSMQVRKTTIVPIDPSNHRAQPIITHTRPCGFLELHGRWVQKD